MSQRDQVRGALCRDLEAAQYTADRAFRQFDASDPENRLVTAELETRWNRALQRVQEIEHKLAQHDTAGPEGTPLPAEARPSCSGWPQTPRGIAPGSAKPIFFNNIEKWAQ